MISKEQLRQATIQTRDHLLSDDRALASKLICEQLVALPEFRNAREVSFYKAMRSEVDLDQAMNEAWKRGIGVALPLVKAVEGSMDFYQVDQDTELTRGSCGSFEPPPIASRKVELEKLQMILVPGVAFDAEGYRLGYGGGYYDRLFEKCPAHVLRVGIAFTEQMVPNVHPEAHDERVDMTITPTGVLRHG